MSFSTSPFGQQPPSGDPVDPFEPVEAVRTPRQPLDPRTLRSLVAGATAVAVLGGGAVGFLWLSSTPSGESADALAGARSTPAVIQPDVVRPSGVAFVGGDPFANNGVTTPAADPGASAGGTSAGSSARGTTGGSAGTTPAVTVPVGTSSRTTAPVTTSPVTPPPAAGAPSTSASKSSAPAWVVPKVTFTGGDASRGTFEVDGETVQVPAGQLVHPLSVRYEGVVAGTTASSASSSSTSAASGGTAVLSTEDDVNVGWLVPSGTALPNAVVGATSGRVYVYGILDDEFFVRVDRNPGVLLAKGTAVAGSPLTFLGPSVDGYSRPGSNAWFSDGTVTYFGQFGAGEGDGVAY